MAQISLTSSMRQNLLSLQNTQEMFDMTQERLSTGKKVNSALDNPGSFFTARALSQRSSDLNGLMDSMGQSIQTLQAADQGIETLTTFVEQAKALVNSARDSAVRPSELESTIKISDFATLTAGLTTITEDDKIQFRTGDALEVTSTDTLATDLNSAGVAALGLATGETFNIHLGDTTLTYAHTGSEDIQDVVSKISALSTDIEAEMVDGKISVRSLNTEDLFIEDVSGNGTVAGLGLDTGIASVQVSAADDADALVSKINAMQDAGSESIGVTAELVDGKLKLSVADGSDLVVQDFSAGVSATALGIDEGTRDGTNDRATYAAQYDDLRTQVNELVQDTSYKGVNLLNGDDLTVIFNEERTSKLEITGVTFDATGLGMNASENNWKDISDIEVALGEVETAISSLRNQATTFGNNLSVVQTREDFTEGMVNTLTSGADKLVLADMNEEAANMLALQTRQQLGTNSLSLASQSAQGVLRLF